MMFTKWRKQRKCFHHDLNAAGRLDNRGLYLVASSYIKSQLIETGKSKMFWCTRCDKSWIF